MYWGPLLGWAWVKNLRFTTEATGWLAPEFDGGFDGKQWHQVADDGLDGIQQVMESMGIRIVHTQGPQQGPLARAWSAQRQCLLTARCR